MSSLLFLGTALHLFDLARHCPRDAEACPSGKRRDRAAQLASGPADADSASPTPLATLNALYELFEAEHIERLQDANHDTEAEVDAAEARRVRVDFVGPCWIVRTVTAPHGALQTQQHSVLSGLVISDVEDILDVKVSEDFAVEVSSSPPPPRSDEIPSLYASMLAVLSDSSSSSCGSVFL